MEVYKIINKVNNKIYIGITKQGYKTRWYKHCSDAYSGVQCSLYNSIRKYGKEKFTVEIIEKLSSEHDYDNLKEREKYWIQYYNSYNRDAGYNLTLGGDGTVGKQQSEETRDKIRQKALGRKVSEETRQKMSLSHKEREYDHKEMSERALLGNKKRWSNPENKNFQSILSPNNKKVQQYTIGGVFLKEYRSISIAALENKINRQNISACLNNRGYCKTAGGYIWKYA